MHVLCFSPTDKFMLRPKKSLVSKYPTDLNILGLTHTFLKPYGIF